MLQDFGRQTVKADDFRVVGNSHRAADVAYGRFFGPTQTAERAFNFNRVPPVIGMKKSRTDSAGSAFLCVIFSNFQKGFCSAAKKPFEIVIVVPSSFLFSSKIGTGLHPSFCFSTCFFVPACFMIRCMALWFSRIMHSSSVLVISYQHSVEKL